MKNPYAKLARLREQGAVHFDEASGVYFVLGHSAFARVSKSTAMGRDTRHWTNGWTHPDYRKDDPVGYKLFSDFQPQMINCDGADHRRMRKVYEPAFRSQAMMPIIDMIEEEAQILLDALPEEGTFDFIKSFAGPLPLNILCRMGNIPREHNGLVGKWSETLIRIGDIFMSPEQKLEALEALTEFKAFLRDLLATRADARDESLIGLALRAHQDGTLNEEETLTNLISMMIAGHETTVTLIGNGMLLLLRNPAEMARLRKNPDLMRTAIEEFLRMEPGGNMILRVALEDFEVEGVRIRKGYPVIGLIGAINRDPGRFERPDELDIGRRANAQFTFGGGAHVCIGAPLARYEGQAAFSSFLNKYQSVELAGEPEWRLDRINARGLGSLPVRVGQAA